MDLSFEIVDMNWSNARRNKHASCVDEMLAHAESIDVEASFDGVNKITYHNIQYFEEANGYSMNDEITSWVEDVNLPITNMKRVEANNAEA